MFNDTIFVYDSVLTGEDLIDRIANPGSDKDSWTLHGEGITWTTDRIQKFDANSLVEESIENGTFDFNVQKPLSWQVSAAELGTDADLYYRLASNTAGIGIKNEDFITWMRTSPLPTFKKLYRRVDLPSERSKLPLNTLSMLFYGLRTEYFQNSTGSSSLEFYPDMNSMV